MVSMADEVNFIDLIALSKIGPDTTSDKYGGLINSSFFDAANILGGLSIKHLVSLSNPIAVTEVGKQFIDEANAKAKTDFDPLDLTILTQIKTGKKSVEELGAAVSVRPRDLALHLFKLTQQGYTTYEFRSGIITLMLTEKGFAQASSGVMPRPSPPQPPAQPAQSPPQPSSPTVPMQTQPTPSQPAAPAIPTPMPTAPTPPVPAASAQASAAQPAQPAEQKSLTPQEVEKKIKAAKMRQRIIVVLVVIIVILAIIAIAKYA